MTLLLDLSPFLILAAIAWLALSAKRKFKRASLIAAGTRA
jgi:hypothetical protein